MLRMICFKQGAPFVALAFILIFAQNDAFSQDGEDWRVYRPKKDTAKFADLERSDLHRETPGKIRIFQNPDIEKLDSLKKIYPSRPNGYRVQIFFGNRGEAREKKVEFLKKYPDHGAYISYLAPNFRLRVGDFRDKISCENFKNEISEDFPASYIVKDKVEFYDFNEKED